LERENDTLRSRVADLSQKGKQVVAERDQWEAEAKRLKQELDLPIRKSPSAAGDQRFAQAKREFARLYHPNALTGSSFERTVRGEIFKEFWEVLQRIENT
jgi:DNA anti-recombination protein RmuC